MSHSRLAPSKADRTLVCAASADREAVIPDTGGAGPANEGSNAHWLLEQGIAEGAWPPAIVAFGPEQLQAALPYPNDALPEELIEQAKQCYEYVLRRIEELGGFDVVEVFSEMRVSPAAYTGRTDSDGTADVVIIAPSLIEVVDLKTGGHLVEPGEAQGMLYALGVLAGIAAEDPARIQPNTKVRLTIFQPKRPGEDTIERFVDREEVGLRAWSEQKWVPAATASDNPNAIGTVSEEGCRFCKAKKAGTCPEYQAAVSGAAAQLFQPVAGSAPDSAMQTLADPMQTQFTVDALSPAQLSAFLEIWPLVKARGKDIEERAFALLKERTAISGFKLVRGKSTRGWGLPEEEQAVKFKNMKLTLKHIYVEKLRSPSQMLALDIPTNKKEAIKKHIVTKEGGLTVVPVSDKRVDAMPAVEFQPVENTVQPEAAASAAPAPALDFLAL